MTFPVDTTHGDWPAQTMNDQTHANVARKIAPAQRTPHLIAVTGSMNGCAMIAPKGKQMPRNISFAMTTRECPTSVKVRVTTNLVDGRPTSGSWEAV